MLNTFISLYNLIYYNDLSEVDTQEVFESFRAFVAETARGQRRERIYRTQLKDLPRSKAFGIMMRLIYTPINRGGLKGETRYIPGQDWRREMAQLRNLFDCNKTGR